MKTKLFISDTVSNAPLVFLIDIMKGTVEIGQTLFTNVIPRTFSITSYEFVSDIADADYVLFPHAIKLKTDPLLKDVADARKMAQTAGKELIVCVGGDLSHDIFIDDVIVLKGLQYGSLKRHNEIIMPCFAEDFGDAMPIVPRQKSARLTVSFCGWAGFSSSVAYVKYLVKIFVYDCWAFLLRRPEVVVFKKGLYWRRKALRLLSRDGRIDTQFIIRTSFSANLKTISLDPARARKEYVDTMYNSDFTLAPKGDGNSSVRFYEAISMGRIPIVIDTDMVFPLEDFIRYADFSLRVPYTEIDRLADIVVDFYAQLSEEKFVEMQKSARRAYEQYLRYDVFLHTLFTHVLPPLSESQ